MRQLSSGKWLGSVISPAGNGNEPARQSGSELERSKVFVFCTWLCFSRRQVGETRSARTGGRVCGSLRLRDTVDRSGVWGLVCDVCHQQPLGQAEPATRPLPRVGPRLGPVRPFLPTSSSLALKCPEMLRCWAGWPTGHLQSSNDTDLNRAHG